MKSSKKLGTVLKKPPLNNDALPIPRSKSETNLNRFWKQKEIIKANLKK